MPQITLNSQKIPFTKKYSNKAKHIRISIRNGELILTIPKPGFFQSKESVEKKALDFLQSKSDWILKHLNPNKKLDWKEFPPTKGGLGEADLSNYSREHYLKYKEEARSLCEDKAKIWVEKMWVSYNRIAIKSLKTKWGSCSSKKNLNFNYKILFLSEKNQNYLIVHELSHLVQMNHSRNFWDLVCETLGSEEFRKYKMLVDKKNPPPY